MWRETHMSDTGSCINLDRRGSTLLTKDQRGAQIDMPNITDADTIKWWDVSTKSLDRLTCNRLVSTLLIVIGSLAGGHGLRHPLESAVVGTPLLVETAPSILHIRHRSSLSASVSLALSLSLSQAPPKSYTTVLSPNCTSEQCRKLEKLDKANRNQNAKSLRGNPRPGTTSEEARSRLRGGVSFSQIYEFSKS